MINFLNPIIFRDLLKNGRVFLLGIFLVLFSVALTTNSFADFSRYVRNNPDGSQTLTGHHYTGSATFLSHPNHLYLNAQIIMPLANQAGLNALIKCQYDPQCLGYHQWLTPTQFNQSFSPSVSDVTEVQELLKPYGIYVRSQTGGVLNVTGSARSFERAFGMQINNYQKSDGTVFFGPDVDPTIPAYLVGKIAAIGGLDNLPKYAPHSHQVGLKTAVDPNAFVPAAAPKTIGSGPGGYLAPNDVKAAYNLNAVPATGVGQSVALAEFDGYSSSDITAYETQFGLPNVPLENVLIDGFNGAPDCTLGQANCTDTGSAEVTLDIDLVAAFAPGSSSILVYEAANTTQAWIDEWTRIATDNKAKVISCSWGTVEQDSPTITFDNQIFQQMAAQGQTVFASTGDYGAYDGIPWGINTLAVDEPADQPYVTGVGISTLTTTSNGTYTGYTSETASVYGGGGISKNWSIPSYQTTLANAANKAANVSKTMRNLPDVVLTADNSTPYSFYVNGSWVGYFGSSLATPIWASFISRVNQGLGSNGPIGQVNLALYKIAQSSSYANDFHDITTGNNGYPNGVGGYSAEPGFDDATGLGSFNGYNLYTDLIKVSAATTTPLAPTGLSAVAGNAQVALSWNASTGATSYDVKRGTSSGTYTTTFTAVKNTSYTDSSVNNNTTYYYVVSAVNSAGQGANSFQVTATPGTVPVAPANLTASAGNGQVTLSWTASTGASSYYILRGTSSGTYSTIAAVGAYTSYIDRSVINGTTYYYVVVAANASGQSGNSNQAYATPAVPVPLPPVPVGFTAVAGYAQVSLSWTASTGAASYNIYRGLSSGGEGATVFKNVVGTTSYVDTGLTNGTTYYYKVSAVNTNNQQSADSSEASAKPAFLAPVLSAAVASSEVILSWSASAGATSYMIKKGTSSGTYPTSIPVANITTYTDNSVIDGTTYYYVVVAVNTSSSSANSNQVSAMPPVPAAPVGLTATGGLAQVSLSWTASAGASSYNIYRGTSSGAENPAPVKNVTGATAYTDTGLSNNTTYYYEVTAVNATGQQSAYSTQASATTLANAVLAPTSVTGVVSSYAGQPAILLQWHQSTSPNISKYNVYRWIANAAPALYGSVGAAYVGAYDTGVNAGVSYNYYMTAVNASGVESPASSTISVAMPTAPAAPTHLTGSVTGKTPIISLQWTQSSSPNVINNVYYSVGGSARYTLLTSLRSTTVLNNITGATPGVTYNFYVTAINSYGQEGSASNVVSIVG